MNEISYTLDRADPAEIVSHLMDCDTTFVPVLSERINIGEYADKIAARACRFEGWHRERLIGLVATYCTSSDRSAAYVTNVSVAPSFRGKGVATVLLRQCISHVKAMGFSRLELRVADTNDGAIALYQNLNFKKNRGRGNMVRMELQL